MSPAALPFLRLALSLLAPLGAGAAANERSAPTRPPAAASAQSASSARAAPAPVAARKIAGRDYVSVADVASRLDLKLSWVERGRKLTLTGTAARAELENDTREIKVNGLRVFLGDPVADAGGQLYVSRIDFERCLTPLLRPGLGTPQPALKTIVLDPGHGGRDNGTSVNEKTYTLDIAKRTKRIRETAGYNVVLTREGDTFIELVDRSEFANARACS